MAQRIEIEVTQGNLNNNHLHLRRHLDFFPADAVGPANLHEGQGRLLTIRFQGLPDPVTTDIAGGNKLFLRDRGSWGRFYAMHRLRAGARVAIERTGGYEYRVSPCGGRKEEARHVQDASPVSAAGSPLAAPAAGQSATAAEVGRFAEFREQIKALNIPLSDAEAAYPQFLLECDGSLEIYYAPMEWVRTSAKVAIVGITPAKQTMRLALETAAAGLQAGEPEAAILDRVKSRASFSGMRTQLVSWLNQLELPAHLGLNTSAALWTAEGKRFMHPTSSIRYPVLKCGANYSGSGPAILQSPMLRRYVEEVLSDELARVPEALIVPLGRRVDEALSWLAERGAVDSERVLAGFPHPSGANAHRHYQWTDNADRLRRQTARWFD